MPQPSLLTVVGIVKEPVYGQATIPAFYIPVGSAPKLDDKVKYIEDKGWRGAMGLDYGLVPGPYWTAYDFGGNVYADTIGFPLAGTLGDVVYSGAGTAPSGVLSAAVSAGAPSVLSSVSFPAGATVQVDNGIAPEVVTTTGPPTGTGPYTIPTPPLKYGHLSGQPITAVQAPYTTQFALLNAGNGQPQSYTMSDWYAVNGRQIPGFVFSEVSFKVTADGLLTYTAKGLGLPTVPNFSKPAGVNWSAVKAIAGWTGITQIGGASAITLLSGDIGIKRKLTPIPTVSGQQAPRTMWAADVSVDFKLELIMEDDVQLLNYINNVQPPLDLNFANGAGAAATQVRFHLSNGGYTSAPIERSKDYVTIGVSGKGLFNTADSGQSGSYSPIKVTVQNALSGALGVYK